MALTIAQQSAPFILTLIDGDGAIVGANYTWLQISSSFDVMDDTVSGRPATIRQ